MATPIRTTAAKARGAAIGPAIVAVVLFIANQYGYELTPIEGALSVLVSAGLAFLGAWMPRNEPKA